MTEARIVLNDIMIPTFKGYLKGDKVYEIGKGVYDYKHYIPNLITIDKDPNKHPDIVMDIETCSPYKADGVLCIGVSECCENPFDLIEGVADMLVKDGKALFSIMLLDSRESEGDFWRFTTQGARKLLNTWFDILEEKIIVSDHITLVGLFIVNKR
jgi:hypothetical protein